MSNIVGDLRYALRMFRHNPGFTAVAVLSLALGIGANTAIFTLVDAVVLKMLPVKDPQELVVFGENLARGFYGSDDPLEVSTTLYSYPNYQDLRENNPVFDGLAAVGSIDATVYVRDPNAPSGTLPEAAQARLVSGDYFELLGVEPMLGRAIHPADDVTAGAHTVVMLSHGYWQRRFASDPGMVGRSLLINGQSYTVIGIAPRGFRGETLGENPDIFAPMAMQNEITRFGSFLDRRNLAFLLLLGRLKEGVTLDQASAAMSLRLQQLVRAEAGELTAEREKRLREIRIEITQAHEALSNLRHEYREPLLLLMSVVGLVLLIACANVANLLLARASSRRKEIGVRLALGAGRGRLVRQLLTESLLLASCGGALGLLIAPWATQLLVGMVYGAGATIPFDIDPDARILGFTCGISLLTGLVFGLAPAVRSTRLDLAPTLKVNARGSVGERSRFGLSKGLVITQVALSLVLLVGASLFAGSLRNLRGLDLGFRPEHVLTVEIDPRGAGYQQEQLNALNRQILEGVRAIPGVESASLSFATLLSGFRRSDRAEIEGYTFQPEESRGIQLMHVSPGYFDAVGMTLLEGRAIDERDREDGAPVIVVNQKLADRFFVGSGAIGKHIRFGGPNQEATNCEIVGVVKDAKYNDLREETPVMVFVPVYQRPQYANSLDIRARGDATALTDEVRQVLSKIDRNLPVRDVTTLTAQVDRSLRQERLLTTLTSFFGLLALLLASIGLFGVMSYAVARRTSEIGIRMALGAERGSVLWMVLRESLALVAIGAVAGLVAASASTRLVGGLLYEISPTDPGAFAVSAAALLAVAALAAYIPALRASRVDPMVALRYE